VIRFSRVSRFWIAQHPEQSLASGEVVNQFESLVGGHRVVGILIAEVNGRAVLATCWSTRPPAYRVPAGDTAGRQSAQRSSEGGVARRRAASPRRYGIPSSSASTASPDADGIVLIRKIGHEIASRRRRQKDGTAIADRSGKS
jgi:hypothetical protein